MPKAKIEKPIPKTEAPLEIEWLLTASLIPSARNARKHSPEQVAQIAASMKQFGFTNPILLDRGLDIVAGHGRILAAQLLGMVRVPCIRLRHLTETQKRAYLIADNKLALNATWDEELLAEEIEQILKEGTVDLEVIGFSENEYREIIDPEGERLEVQASENEGVDLKVMTFLVKADSVKTIQKTIGLFRQKELGGVDWRGEALTALCRHIQSGSDARSQSARKSRNSRSKPEKIVHGKDPR
jgi:hypothetical protein